MRLNAKVDAEVELFRVGMLDTRHAGSQREHSLEDFGSLGSVVRQTTDCATSNDL